MTWFEGVVVAEAAPYVAWVLALNFGPYMLRMPE
jgi:hypothetical protein